MQAMESRVELVMLWGESSLDIEALAKYSGQGCCLEMMCSYTLEKFFDKLRTWARRKNWLFKVTYGKLDGRYYKYVSLFESLARSKKQNMFDSPIVQHW